MEDEGRIFAFDLHYERAELLREQVERSGAACISTSHR